MQTALKHFASPKFWRHYEVLPQEIKDIADKNFKLLKVNPNHPSLQFKNLRNKLWSVRVTQAYRALALKDGSNYNWFWIDHHDEYERLIKSIECHISFIQLS